MSTSTLATPDRDVGTMRVKDARVAIGRAVGRRQNPRSPLSKGTLNSIHRYLTGEFHYQPKVYGTPFSSDLEAVRSDIIIHLAGAGYDAFKEMLTYETEEGEDGEEVSVVARPVLGRPFRRAELRALLRALRDHADHRPE